MATYKVTGNGGGPDGSPNGVYYQGGTYGGQPYYRQVGGAEFYLFWDVLENSWTIAIELIDEMDNRWYKSGAGSPEGDYIALDEYTGEPVCAFLALTPLRTLMGAGT